MRNPFSLFISFILFTAAAPCFAQQAAKTAPPAMITRTFDVLLTFTEAVTKTREELAASTKTPPTEDTAAVGMGGGGSDLKPFFGRMGVEWPVGSSIKYVASIGKLIVTNTPENIEKLEAALARLNVVPSQIEIEVQFLEYSMDDLDAMSRTGPITVEALTALRKKGKAKLLAAPCVATKAGQEATVKGVTEYIYPTEFSVASGGDSNNPASSPTGLVEPGAFETREVGVILSVMAEVSPEGGIISLTMTPEVVQEPTWKDYGQKVLDPKGREQSFRMEQPFFQTLTATTQIAIKDGATILFSGGMNGRDGKTAVYTFVTARLVDLEGKPLRKKTPEDKP